MSTERWQELDRIFIEAVQRPAGERSAFVQKSCTHDAALKDEALALLAAVDESNDFMSTSALEHLAKTIAATGWSLQPAACRAYTVLNRLASAPREKYGRARTSGLARSGDHDRAATRLERCRAPAPVCRRARLAGSLNHPNLLTVHDAGEHAVLRCSSRVSRWTELAQRLEVGPSISVGQAISVAIGVARGLAAAHARHRASRRETENVFLRTDGTIKILDFGLAKLLPPVGSQLSAQRLTIEGLILGTAGYMAPEQIKGEPVDARADLFAVGVMTYEMLTGSNPFKGATLVETLHATLTADVPDLAATGRGIPRARKVGVRTARETPKRGPVRARPCVGARAGD